MRLESVEMVNWCQHKSLSIDFGDVTLLRGANGVGKSSVISAISYALFGPISKKPGGVKENIRHGLAKKDESYVSLSFSHADVSVQVKRFLRPENLYVAKTEGSSKELSPLTVTGATAFSNWLTALLGLSRDFYDAHVFVPQESLTEFLSTRGADRAAFFAEVLGVSRAEVIREAVSNVLCTPSFSSQPNIPTPEQLQADIEQLQGEKTELETEMQKTQEQLASLETVKAIAVDHQSRRQRATELNKKIDRLSADLTSLRNDCAEVTREINALQKSTPQDPAMLKELSTRRAAIAADLIAYRNYSKWNNARTAHDLEQQRKREKCEAAIAALLANSAEIAKAEQEGEKLPQLRDKLANLAIQCNYLAHRKGELEGQDSCPVCGAEVSADALATDTAVLEKLRAEIKTREEEIRQIEELFNTQVVPHRLRLAKLQNDLKDAAKPYPVFAPPRSKISGDEQRIKAEAELAAIEEQEKREATQRMELARLEERLRASAKAGGAAQAALLEAQTARQDIGVWIDGIVDRLPVTLAAIDAATHTKVEQAVKLKDIVSKINIATTMIDMSRSQYRKWSQVEKKRQQLTALRQLFSRDALPAKVLQQGMLRLSEAANEVLAQFDVNLRVVDVFGTQIQVSKGDYTTSASRLSRGEKAVLALAMRTAVYSSLTTSVGLLVLDEPTDGMDARNRGLLAGAISKLREVTPDVQLVLVTHDRCLDTLADKIIDL